MTVKEAAALMLREDRSELIVVDGPLPVGIVTERDVVRRLAAKGLDASQTQVDTIMSRQLVTIAADRTLDEAIETMARKRVRRLVVMEGEVLLGVLTESDVREAFQKCGHCHREIPPVSSRLKEPYGFVTCSCNTRYHRNCAEQVVHCVHCGTSLVTEIVYPHPEDTTGG